MWGETCCEINRISFHAALALLRDAESAVEPWLIAGIRREMEHTGKLTLGDFLLVRMAMHSSMRH